MTNNVVRTAAEGMPDVNRRRLLLGLASASAVAATVSIPQADATPLENPELIRLGNELPAFEREHQDAAAALKAIKAEWRPLWPLAPEEIVCRTRYYGDEIERGLSGGSLTRRGEERPLRVRSEQELVWWQGQCEGDLASKRVKCEKRRARLRQSVKELKQQIRIAKKYEAECARITTASGIRAGEKRETTAAIALTKHVDAIMAQPETSMAGLMVKAQAMSAWKSADISIIGMLEAKAWGPSFAASLIRLSEGGAV
ncbi:MAG TPA: hypothetical protein VGX71_13530 [Pseudaminobacter sp.]|nr:hypothetical protein [Pseudaminobacter sp.]